MAEINEKLLNLSFRNFTNINGEDPNVFVGKRGKEKRMIPFFIKVSLILLALTAKHSTLPSLTSFFSEQPAQSSQRRNQKRKAEKHRRKEKAVEKDHGWP